MESFIVSLILRLFLFSPGHILLQADVTYNLKGHSIVTFALRGGVEGLSKCDRTQTGGEEGRTRSFTHNFF